MKNPGEPAKTLLDSARNLAAHFLNSLKIRLDLIVTELEEEYLRMVQIFIFLNAAIFFMGMSLITGSLLFVVYFWDDYRLTSLVCLLILYVTMSGVALALLRRYANAKPKLFEASLSEIRKDCDILNDLENDTKN